MIKLTDVLVGVHFGRRWAYKSKRSRRMIRGSEEGPFLFVATPFSKGFNYAVKDIEGRRFHYADTSPVLDSHDRPQAAWSIPLKGFRDLRIAVTTHFPMAHGIDWKALHAEARAAHRGKRKPRALPESPKPAPAPERKPARDDSVTVRVIETDTHLVVRIPSPRNDDRAAAFNVALKRAIPYRHRFVPYRYSESLQAWLVRIAHADVVDALLAEHFDYSLGEHAAATCGERTGK